MALFYTTKSSAIGKTEKDIEVHMGNNGELQIMRNAGRRVVELQADGNELEAIRRQFTGIPMHNGRVVEWFGDTAAFIAMHLR